MIQKTFLEGLVQEWRAPSITLCKEVYSVMVEHITKLIHKHFGGYGQGFLEQRVR